MIGHALTTNDLKDLLNRVNTGEVRLKLSRSLSTDLSELSSEDMEKLVGFYRNPLEHLLPNEKKILWEELEKSGIPLDNRILANEEYEYHIRKLAGNLEKEEKCTEEDLKLLSFAVSEQLARVLAYVEPDTICESMVIPIPVFTKQQDIVYYQLKDHINEKGLHCYLFTPLKGDFPAQLVFRGTDDIESLSRDVLDLNGIGKTVFDEYKDQIAAMIETYCRTTEKPSLEITGHSLGGSDAQRATIFCLERFNQENNNGSISRLSRINCFAFCSPKLDQATVKSWEEQLDILKSHSSPPRIGLNFCYHKNDLLTQVGFKNIYIKENLSFLQENYLQITSDSGILATNTHHREPFFKGGKFYPGTDNRKYIHYNSRIFTDLKKKINLLQEFIEKESGIIFSNEDLETIELSKQKLVKMKKNKEEIQSYQEGYSSDSSWGIYFAYKSLIAPAQWLFHWMKSNRFYQERRLPDSWKTSSVYKLLMTSKQRISHWMKTPYIKV
jgi:Lipase (class 3)